MRSFGGPATAAGKGMLMHARSTLFLLLAVATVAAGQNLRVTTTTAPVDVLTIGDVDFVNSDHAQVALHD